MEWCSVKVEGQLYLCQNIWTVYGAHPTSYQIDSQDVNWPESEADNLCTSSAKVKNVWSCNGNLCRSVHLVYFLKVLRNDAG
jgi:hypothetical protein